MDRKKWTVDHTWSEFIPSLRSSKGVEPCLLSRKYAESKFGALMSVDLFSKWSDCKNSVLERSSTWTWKEHSEIVDCEFFSFCLKLLSTKSFSTKNYDLGRTICTLYTVGLAIPYFFNTASNENPLIFEASNHRSKQTPTWQKKLTPHPLFHFWLQ